MPSYAEIIRERVGNRALNVILANWPSLDTTDDIVQAIYTGEIDPSNAVDFGPKMFVQLCDAVGLDGKQILQDKSKKVGQNVPRGVPTNVERAIALLESYGYTVISPSNLDAT